MSEVSRGVAPLFEELCRRMPHAEIMERMRSEIRATFVARSIPFPADVSVLFDDTRGAIVLVSDAKVWDGELATVANESAGNTLRLLLQETQASFEASKSNTSGVGHSTEKWKSIFFWGLNGVVLLYWVGWFVSFIFSSSFREWYDAASASDDFGILGLLLFILLPAIPLCSVIGALLARRGILSDYSYDRTLVRFEIPALISAFVLNWVLPNMPLTDALRVLFVALYVVTIVYWYLVAYRIPATSLSSTLFRMVLGSITVIAAFYLSLLIVVTPYLALLSELVSSGFRGLGDMFKDPMTAMMVLMYALFALAPLAIWFVLAKHITNVYRDVCSELSEYSTLLMRIIRLGTPIAFILILFAASWQFSGEKYKEQLVLLAREEGGYSGQAVRAHPLVENKDAVDGVLRRTIYARDRYLFTNSELYRESLVNSYLLIVAFPFVYDDSAAEYRGYRYGREQDSVFSTLQTGYRLAFGADISSVNTRTVEIRKLVELLSRDVQVLTDGSPVFATVTITDSLSSFMPSDQEAVYEFSLPENAVVTGLRLGPSLEFAGEIAPRGAAQQTYINQVQRSRDPALLEQVGPRQYRLRVYPVPGVSDAAERIRREKVEGFTQRVQLSYKVLREQEGIPLPVYAKQYNLLADDAKVKVEIDGKSSQISKDAAFAVDRKEKAELCSLTGGQVVSLPEGGEARLIYARDARANAPAMSLCGDSGSALRIQNKNIAILVDTSYKNMDGSVDKLLEQVRALPKEFFVGNVVRYYSFSGVLGTARDIKQPSDVPQKKDVVYFGKGDIAQALRGLGGGFDVVFVLTGSDPSFEDTAQLGNIIAVNNAMLFFVHPEGKVPAYPVSFSSLTDSAKSVSVLTDISDALPRIGNVDVAGVTHPLIGSYWYIEAPESVVASPAPSYVMSESGQPLPTPPAPVSNSSGEQKILLSIVEHADISRLKRTYVNNPAAAQGAFDVLHARAKTYGIVTPLSSYIALVNDTQRNLLNTLSNQQGKYTSEQVLTVAQPTFASPMSRGGGGFGMQSSLGLSGTVTTSAPPAFMAPSGAGGGGGYNNPLGYSYDKSVVSEEGTVGAETNMLLPKLIIFFAVLLILGAGSFVAYRFLRRAHR